MDGASPSAAGGPFPSSSSSAAASGSRGREPGRLGATNIGRLRQGRQHQQQHAARAGMGVGVTSCHLRVFAAAVGLLGCALLAASLAMSALHQELKQNIVRKEQVEQIMHARLLQMATSALTKNGSEPEDLALWEEPYKQARKWKPCAAKHSLADEDPDEIDNGFILVSANGGLNQQRVAVRICCQNADDLNNAAPWNSVAKAK